MTNKILGLDLEALIESITKTAVEDLTGEKKRQAQASIKMKPFKHRDSPKKETDVDEDDGSEQKSDRELVKPKKSKLPEVTLTKVISKLNILRSGRSLKDPKSKKDLKLYFDRLNGSERVALFAFLTGLSKIMADEDDVVGDDTKTPAQEPYDISMKKTQPDIKKGKPEGEGSPIVVGESANTAKELALLKRYR